MSNRFDTPEPNPGVEACLTLEKLLNKLLTKFNGINDHASRVLLEAITHVKNLQAELNNAPEDHILTNLQASLIKDALNKLKETLAGLAAEHRELHVSLSKFGKLIDRNFVADYAATSKPHIFNSPSHAKLINRVICQHYHRQGMADVAEALAQEAGIEYEFSEKEAFRDLNHIIDCLRNKDLDPAIAWADEHSEDLIKMNSTLEFRLHKLKFLELLSKGTNYQTEAISHARTHFRKFVKKHQNDIQILMGMLLYIPNGIESSPYSSLINEEFFVETFELFVRDSCQLLGITVNSPLATLVHAGCAALPALLNIKQVMTQRQVSGIWNGKDEIPEKYFQIEIDLGPDGKYHSMFACPILRQQSTKNNPPMRLICGHVISRDALNKLCNGSKMKCPYCPVEQSPLDARMVIF